VKTGEDLLLLLGDEAVALGAVHSDVRMAYSYPGTPATEILEAIRCLEPSIGARWTVNEKTAFEQALGVAYAGSRVLVSMKHVGLNVAADPFVNSALLPVPAGLVLAVADDPGMHSSQNEQDSRFYAEFSRIPCYEPADHQEAYEMTRAAFATSERFRIPVMVRLVTNLAHSRGLVEPRVPDLKTGGKAEARREEWVLLPSYARKRWKALLEKQEAIRKFSAESRFNRLDESAGAALGVVTAGLGRQYFREFLHLLGNRPRHLHIGFYPPPGQILRKLLDECSEVLFLEEGYPFLERRALGFGCSRNRIRGKLSGILPADGELTPESVAAALGLETKPAASEISTGLPARPPRLCDGCPHLDTSRALNRALQGYEDPVVTTDIGCYTLAALPPLSTGDTCVAMGVSIGMAQGVSQAGRRPVVAVIGDSTFLHSGMTGLVDAVHVDADITVLILDNSCVGMTGGQETPVSPGKLVEIVNGLGVPGKHIRTCEAHPGRIPQMAGVIDEEIRHRGLSVVISSRECVRFASRSKRSRK